MRPTNHIPPTPKNRSLEEPRYVDEVYPEDVNQEELWARKDQVEAKEPENPEPSLSFEDEEEEDEEEQEIVAPVQPAPKPVIKPIEQPRSYRVKMPPPVRRTSDTRQPIQQKPLPTELPRPSRRDRRIPPQETRREERTGTWPLSSEPKRNPPPPTNGPTPTTGRVVPSERQAPIVNRQPERVIPPRAVPATPTLPEQETIPAQEYSVPLRESRETSTPPPILPVMPPTPIEQTPEQTQRFFQVEDPGPNPQPSNFRPLIAEGASDSIPSEDEAQEQEWEQAETTHTRLRDLINRLPLPQNSLILGVCEDGLPLVLELADPSPGALLFLGDDVKGLRKHLQAVLASVCRLSDPKQVQVDIISPEPEAFAAQKRLPHVQKVHLPDQEEVFDLLGCLFELIEQRQRKDHTLTGKLLKEFLPKQKDPFRILLIDQLDVLVEQLAPESLAYLRWLLRRGPAANVWVLASLNARNSQDIDGKTLKSFGLQVAGEMQFSQQASRLTALPLDKLSKLIAGEQACIKLDEDVIEFSILEI